MLHPDFESSEGRIAANRLRQSLHTLGERFFLGKNLSESQWVWAQCVTLSCGLCGGDAERYAPKLAFSLHTHGMSLQALGRMAEACHAKEEAITLVETLCGRDPIRYRPILAELSHNYSAYLREAQRIEESCSAAGKAVDHLRQLYKQDPNSYQPDFAEALCSYGISLYDNLRIEEACATESESVALRRHLFELHPDQYRSELSTSLHLQSVCLFQAPRTELTLNAACAAAAEAVALRRHIYQLNPEQSAYQLSTSLQCYSMCLYETGDLGLACDLEAEVIVLLRDLCVRGVDQYRSTLAELIQIHQVHLREAGFEPSTEVVSAEVFSAELGSTPTDLQGGSSAQISPRSSQIEVFEVSQHVNSNQHLQPSSANKIRPFRAIIRERIFRVLEIWNTLPADRFVHEKSSRGELALARSAADGLDFVPVDSVSLEGPSAPTNSEGFREPTIVRVVAGSGDYSY